MRCLEKKIVKVGCSSSRTNEYSSAIRDPEIKNKNTGLPRVLAMTYTNNVVS